MFRLLFLSQEELAEYRYCPKTLSPALGDLFLSIFGSLGPLPFDRSGCQAGNKLFGGEERKNDGRQGN